MFIRRQVELIEIQTKNESIGRKTPLLVAASSGALEAVKTLIELGANISFQDEFGNNVIHVATHRFGLEYQIAYKLTESLYLILL